MLSNRQIEYYPNYTHLHINRKSRNIYRNNGGGGGDEIMTSRVFIKCVHRWLNDSRGHFKMISPFSSRLILTWT